MFHLLRTDESSPKCPKFSKSPGIKQCKKNLSESPELRHHNKEIFKEFSSQTKCEDISPELQEREEILNEFPRSRPLEENLSESDVHRSCREESSPCQPKGGLFGFTPFYQQGSPQLQHLLPWNPLQFRAPNHPLVGPWDTPYLPQVYIICFLLVNGYTLYCIFYIKIWLVCPINVKTAEPIGPNFFVGSHVTPGKVYGW